MKYIARKFLMALIYGAVVITNKQLELELNEWDLCAMGGVLASFILGESYLDGKRISKKD